MYKSNLNIDRIKTGHNCRRKEDAFTNQSFLDVPFCGKIMSEATRTCMCVHDYSIGLIRHSGYHVHSILHVFRKSFHKS